MINLNDKSTIYNTRLMSYVKSPANPWNFVKNTRTPDKNVDTTRCGTIILKNVKMYQFF